MLDKSKRQLLKEIGKAAVDLDWKVAFGGKSFGNHHLERVNKIAKYLQRVEGGDPFIVLAGAWVHDAALAYGKDDEPKVIAKHTKSFLKKFCGLKSEEIERIVGCAAGHEEGTGLSVEAKIVHDADVIDKSGMLGLIRHTWKMTNLLEERLLQGNEDLEKLVNHINNRRNKIFTKTAKDIVKNLDKSKDIFVRDRRFALETLPIISEMAMEGKTSDLISEWLIRTYNHASIRALKAQLQCDYLKRRQFI
mgnify:CR=1 FL=1